MSLRAAASLAYSNAAPAVVTLTGSPFVGQNTSSGFQQISVSGGTVTGLDYSRDGSTYIATGFLGGTFPIFPGDYYQITYSVAPTVYLTQMTGG